MSFSHRGSQEDSQRHQPPAQALTSLRRAVETTINSSTTLSFRKAIIPSYSSSFTTPTRGGGQGGGVLSIGRASVGRRDPQCRVSPDSVAVFNDSFRQGEEQQRPPSRAGSSGGGRHHSNNANFVHGGTSPTPKMSEKHKTEMCKNMLERGFCKYGYGCIYAHSEEERRNPTKVPDGHLMLPCLICIMTGICPYSNRCKCLHDPSTMTVDVSKMVILDHCTKAKKNSYEIPDPLYHHHVSSMSQANPLIAQSIWQNCREFRLPDSALATQSAEFVDTYNLVCNRQADAKVYDVDNLPRVFDVTMLRDELRMLLVVLRMRSVHSSIRGNVDQRKHINFTFAPTECINSQPCMLVQTGYFCFPSSNNEIVSLDQLVVEITVQQYNTGKESVFRDNFVCARELVFDSKGKRSCNLSIWFDVNIMSCSGSQAKKQSKMVEQWNSDDTKGQLFLMPVNEKFVEAYDAADPFVLMQPVDDREDGHILMQGMIKHRVACILRQLGFQLQEPVQALSKLSDNFRRMKIELERWLWPKTTDTSHFSKQKEEQTQSKYLPKKDTEASAIWSSFKTNLSVVVADNNDISYNASATTRLSVFLTIEAKSEMMTSNFAAVILPRITTFHAKHNHLAYAEATWRELLLGEGEDRDGSWKRSIDWKRFPRMS